MKVRSCRVMAAIVVLVCWPSRVDAQFSTGLELVDPAIYQGIPLASTPLMGRECPASIDRF